MHLLLSLLLACGGNASDAWSLPGAGIPVIDEAGAITTESGLTVVITQDGGGDTLKEGNKVQIHYHGWLAADETLFDSSANRGRPLELTMGRGMVIAGWEQGLSLLDKGSRARLRIPSELGYQKKGHPPVIPPDADLVFDVWIME